jgi:hypothetical protein
MRHRSMAGLSLAIATIICGTVGAAAQATADGGQDCVGTWLLRVTALDQPESPGFPVTATFGADGSFITEGAPVSAGPPDAPENVTVASTAQGVWEPTESGACAVNHLFYNSDLGGNLVSTVEIRIVVTVGPDGNTMTSDGPDFATVTAADGTVLFSGPSNTVEGTRLVLQLPPTG